MGYQFEDIRIIDLDVDRTRPSGSGSAMRHMYLRLSAPPPREWIQVFDNERSFPRHSMWRRAWVEGQFVVVDCVPEEMERYHLTDLKQDAANSNAKYREYLAQVATKQRREEEHQQQEKSELQNLKKKLSFD